MKGSLKGIVMKIDDGIAHVFTNDCRMIVTPATPDMIVGKEITAGNPAVAKEPVKNRILTRTFVRAAAAAAAVLLVIAGVVAYPSLIERFKPSPAGALVSIDINPSLQLRLDEELVVHDVFPIDEDAETLVKTVDLRNLTFEDAMTLWVAAAKAHGMGGDGNVLITALYNGDGSVLMNRLGALSIDGVKLTIRSEDVSNVDKNEILLSATSNGLSVGRQMILSELEGSNIDLSAPDIADLPLGQLIEYLNSLETPTPTSSPTTTKSTAPTPTPTPMPTMPPTPTPTPEATQAPEPTAVPQPTTPPTAPPTEAPYNNQFSVSDNGAGLTLNWGMSPEGQSLSYYKVVISASDSTPMYSESGYQYALDRATTSCTIDNACKYNGGDFGGYLTPGQNYYFAITYVFKDGKVSSNVVYATYNGPAYVAPAMPTGMTIAQPSPGTLKWTRSPVESGFSYYKVVFSKTVSTPIYPDNGYLYALGINSNSCTFSAGMGYNGNSDFGGSLVAGDTYYVTITYVYNFGKTTSNVIQVTVPATTPAPTLTLTQPTANTLQWTRSPIDAGFNYYKVVFSKTDSTPVYPDNGYLQVLGIDTTACGFCAGDCYNGTSDFGGCLESGKTYYVAITYVYDSGKYTSNVIQVTVP